MLAKGFYLSLLFAKIPLANVVTADENRGPHLPVQPPIRRHLGLVEGIVTMRRNHWGWEFLLDPVIWKGEGGFLRQGYPERWPLHVARNRHQPEYYNSVATGSTLGSTYLCVSLRQIANMK